MTISVAGAKSLKPRAEIVWIDDPANLGDRRLEVIAVNSVPGYDPFGRGSDIVAAVVRTPQVGGRLDLIMSMQDVNTALEGVFVMLNDGTNQPGVTQWTRAVQGGVNSYGIDFGKFGAGVARDVILAQNATDQMRFVQGDGMGAFALQTLERYPTAPAIAVYGVAIGQLDLNNRNDVVVACQAPEVGGVLYHGGVAVFQGIAFDRADPDAPRFLEPPRLFRCSPVDPLFHPKPRFVKIADMNDDSYNDIVTSNTDDGNIGVLINCSVCAQ